MTDHPRVIVCLDVRAGRVVKGVSFEGLRDAGDPAELALRYEAEGADEIVILDISTSKDERRTTRDTLERVVNELSAPVTLGGGIRTLDDIDRAVQSGATKVSINTAAIERPALLAEASDRFGSGRIIASIDAKREDQPKPGSGTGGPKSEHGVGGSDGVPSGATITPYTVYTHGGRTSAGLDAIEWARRCAELGAGEILLTSIDRDGHRSGYDLELTRAVADAVDVPVIASGGAGTALHFYDAFTLGHASGALAAGIFHDGSITITEVKRHLAEHGIHAGTRGGEEQ